MRRTTYDPVAASEEPLSADSATAATSEAEPRVRFPGRGVRYSRIDAPDTAAAAPPEGGTNETLLQGDTLATTTNSTEEMKDDDDGTRINVTVLDFAQNRFTVPVHPNWTVATLKSAGAKIHKVPPDRQRLIFRGKMLADNMTLTESGITQDDVIVHLFPKPRVVVRSGGTNKNASESDNESGNNTTTPAEQQDGEEEEGGSGGAHVPTIVMDADEAGRRSQILVLGSVEYTEAQNNVKLFSFMLLIISSMELLNLMSIAFGVVPDQYSDVVGTDDIIPLNNLDDEYNPFDDVAPPSGGGGTSNGTQPIPNPALEAYKEWPAASWIDLAISLLGVYVALLGLKASTENTLRQARWYLMGTFLTGFGWLVYNYFYSVLVEQVVQENHKNHPGQDPYYNPDNGEIDVYNQALQVMILPFLVWTLCCYRAYEFQRLLRDAEEEAERRIRSEWADLELGSNNSNGNSSTDQAPTEGETRNDQATPHETGVLT